MKNIATKKYVKWVQAQRIIDWDDPDAGPVNINEFFVDQEEADLPVIREEDLGQILEDDLELGEEAVPEGAPVTDVKPEVPPEDRPQFNNKHEALAWAEDNNEVVEINYTTKGGTNLIREVEPHGKFYAHTTHRNILVTFDRSINAIRAFIIKNVNTLDFTGKRFQKKFVVKS